MPEVSIIVPVFDSAKYICECIESILNQSFRDFELILVDDGSRDSSGMIVDDYAARDERITVIHKENGGPSSARNAGLDIASSPFVYMPDSDDILEPSLLETVIPRMEEGYDMTVFGFRLLPPATGEEKRRMSYKARKEQSISLDTDEARYAFIIGPFRRRGIRWEVWNRVFRRDIIEKWKIRFGDDRRVFAEDMYFTYFYLLHTSNIFLFPDILYTYRRHEGSESTEYRKHLMIYSSNRMTESLYEHCRTSNDCVYIYDHFLPLYYLLHKGALRRLRRHQWKNGLGIHEAKRILKDNTVDYDVFLQRMRGMYNDPVVRKSYRKDRNRILQITDRLYTGELLEMPCSRMAALIRKRMIRFLQAVYNNAGI